MVKFKITPERFSEACSIIQYVNVMSGNTSTIMAVSPYFIVDDKDEYIVKITLDEDGDIKERENIAEAFDQLSNVTPKRLEKLLSEFREAASNIVNENPTKADSQKEKD